MVKEFLEKSLSEGGEGDTGEDGKSSDESDDHQPMSEAEDEGHKITLNSLDLLEVAVLDLVMYGTESNMEDVVLKVLELNVPDVSREEKGGENGKDSREEEEGEENSNASPSPTLVVGEDVVMRVVELNMSVVLQGPVRSQKASEIKDRGPGPQKTAKNRS